MKYNICPYCGAHLDFGEPCDCKEEQRTPQKAEKGGDGEDNRVTLAGRAIPRNGHRPVRVG